MTAPIRPVYTVVLIVALALLSIVGYVVIQWSPEKIAEYPVEQPATTTPEAVVVRPERVVIGTSVEGREIEAYTYGEGEKHILFVGGIHGGYEWNGVLLAYEAIEYLKANAGVIPKNLMVTIIPSLNPDGVFDVIKKEGRFALGDVPKETGPVGTGRFNAHNVDLNRNFDCKWKGESKWRGNTVSAGTKPFSEPESLALRDFIGTNTPVGVVFWHSQANAVYASECEAGILPTTHEIMDVYAKSAGYPAVSAFDAYEVTGDAEGWLASIGIPAITVELKTHETVEWEQNFLGMTALLDYFAKTQ